MRLQSKGTPDAVNGATINPLRLAIERILQCVACRGVDSNVSVSTCSTLASVIVRGAPGRASSSKPSRRLAKNRLRHFPTHCLVMCICSATCELVLPLDTPQDNACSLRQGLCCLGSSCPAFQCFAFLLIENQSRDRTSSTHCYSPSSHRRPMLDIYLMN